MCEGAVGCPTVLPRLYSSNLFAVSHYLTEERLSTRGSSDLLPDVVRCVHEMVCDWIKVVDGEEGERLSAIRVQFETILNELNEISRKPP